MKLTRAYIEGFVEGRTNPAGAHAVNPHSITQSKNEWERGRERGLVLKHFHDGTSCADTKIKSQVNDVRIDIGEKV